MISTGLWTTLTPKKYFSWDQWMYTITTLLILFLLLLNLEYFKVYEKNELRLLSLSPRLEDDSFSSSLRVGRGIRHNNSKKHKKWIVVTSIFLPTEQIKKLSQIPGWKLLVVADKKTPSDWRQPNAILLDIDTQFTLGYRVLEYLSWNSYTRKVIGYLYAIQHGAQFIYDTDDDNAPNNPQEFEKSFVFEKTSRGLVLNGSESVVANPYVHFGQPTVWPRGFPLEHIGQTYNNTYLACPIHTPIIQQGLVNGDPDVDAIFRLTRKQLHTPLNIQFDSSAPPIILPKSVLAPFNSQNTIFHYDAFWALLLPVSVSSRVTDIWRGYWAQSLLSMMGGHLGFYPPQTTQIRNSHIYLRDFEEEDRLYKQAGNLTQFLADWNCDAKEFYPCMVALTSAMVEMKMWSKIEIGLVEAWILDLKSVGYKEPIFSCLSLSPCIGGNNTAIAMFSPADPELKIRQDYRIPLLEFCSIPLPLSTQNPMNFPSTLLVVTYNFPHYENIWLLDSIYRPHYPNILYCGHLKNVGVLHKLLASKEFMDAGVEKFSFIHANISGNHNEGLFGYECGMRAIDMNYNVKGYLVLSDDVLLNFWNTKHFNLEEAWFPANMISKYNLATKENLDDWLGWKSKYYHKFATDAIQKSLKKIYSSTNQYVQEFRSRRDSFGYNETTVMHAFADIFYFPASKQEMFYEVASILREFEVHLEIANPFLVTGISSPKDIVNLPGKYIWGDQRVRVFDYFNQTDVFLHPVKSGQFFQYPEIGKQFCDKYVWKVLRNG